MTPSVEHTFHGIDHILQFGEVSIMSSFSPRDFPNPLNGIEFRAVGRHKLQRKFLMAIQSPFSMKLSVVVSDVVDDQHNPPSRVRTDLAQVFEEAKECLPIELVCFSAIDELAISDSHCSEISHALSCRMMEYNWVFHIFRNPHAAPGSMLLEPDLVQGPDIDSFILQKSQQFFYIPPAGRDQRAQFSIEACGVENRVAGKGADTAERQGRCPIGPE